MECPKCDQKVEGNYCANCGRPVELPRISMSYILYEIGSVLSFRKGILFTLRELLLRPGASIKTFILEDRNRLVKPIIFTIFCSIIYTFVQQQLHFEDAYYEEAYSKVDEKSASLLIVDWIRQNYGYANILMGLFIVPWLKVFFRKYDYNFFELLVLWLFVSGMSMFIYLISGVIETFTDWPLFFSSTIVALLYASWAMGQFFDKNKFLSYLKAVIAYILGNILFLIFGIFLGLILDWASGNL